MLSLPAVLRAGVGVLVGLALLHAGAVGLLVAGLGSVVAFTVPAARMLATFAFGAVLGVAVAARERSPPGGDDLTPRLGPGETRVSVEGTVVSAEPAAPDGTRLVLEATSFETAEGRTAGAARLHVVVLADLSAEAVEPHPGDEVLADGLASPLVAPTNPGGYDAKAAWARAGVHARLVVPDPRGLRILLPSDGPLAALSAARDECARAFSAALSPEDGGLLRSLLLGDRGALDPRDRKRFRDAGVSHILAISGAHVALLIVVLLFMMRRLGCAPRLSAGLLLVVVVLFVPFTGSAPPVVRSAAGCVLYLAGRLLGREPSAGVLLAAVAGGYVVLEPLAFDDPGFRLSFAAAAGMVLLAGRLLRWMVPERPALPGMPSRPRAPIRAAIAVGVAAWLCSLPVALHDLGQVPWIAVPMGLVAVPLSSLVMGVGAVFLAVRDVPLLGPATATVVHALMVALRWFLDLTQVVGIGNHFPAPAPLAWYLAYVVAIVAAARGTRRIAAAGWGLLVLLLGILAVPPSHVSPENVRLTLLDVGHGQAGVLEMPDGQTALLDAGSRDRPEPADRIVLPALRALGVRSLSLAVASHSDFDHAGALPAVLDQVPTAKAAVPPAFPPAMLDALRARCGEASAVADGDVLLSGPWGSLRVIGPGRSQGPLPRRTTNDGCLVLLLETPSGRVFLPGDREVLGIDDLLRDHPDLPADVLVLPHHGHVSSAREHLMAACGAPILLASAPGNVVERLPRGTRCTGSDGALVLDLAPDGPRLSTPWSPGRRESSVYDPPPDARPPMNDSLHLLIAGLLLVGVALASARLGWLTHAGSSAAACLGFAAVHAFGWRGLAALLAPFLAATLLGRAPGGLEKPGPRTLRQVGANGLPAVAGIILTWAGRPAAGIAAFLGALAALGGDTIATEVGTRWGGAPRSVLSWRRMGPGESGGVTLVGTIASLAGAALAPAAFLAFGEPPWAALVPLAAAGVIAGLLDSVLGAALQRKGRCPSCGGVVESAVHCGDARPARLAGRFAFLDNDAVNLVNGLAGAASAVAFLGA